MQDIQEIETIFRELFIKMNEKHASPMVVKMISHLLQLKENLDEAFENSVDISKQTFCGSYNATVSEWEEVSFGITQLIEHICDASGHSLLFRKQMKLCGRLFVFETFSFLIKIMFLRESLFLSSDIVHRYKGVHEIITKVIPDPEEFLDFLWNDAVPNHSVLEIFDNPVKESLKFFLAKHALDEKSKTVKFYEEIEAKQQALIESTPHQTLSIETTTATEDESKNLVLSQREIALIYWYDRDILSIDLKTSQKIAEDNGHKSKNSGRGIYNDHYTKVRDKPEERTDNDTSEKYLINIIPRLTTERGKREANEDLTKAKYLKENKKKGLFY